MKHRGGKGLPVILQPAAALANVQHPAEKAAEAARLVRGPGDLYGDLAETGMAVERQLSLKLQIGLVGGGAEQAVPHGLDRVCAHDRAELRTAERADDDARQTGAAGRAGRESDRVRMAGKFKPELLRQVAEKAPLGQLLLHLLRHARRGELLPTVVRLPDELLRPTVRRRLRGGLGPCAVLEGVGNVIQAFQQQRVEAAAFAAADHFERFLVGKRLLVAALARQRVVSVGKRDDLRGDGDILALEAVWVALAVPALMVPAADLKGVFDDRFILIDRQVGDDLRAQPRVLLDDVELTRRERGGLGQDVLGDEELADIVQARGDADGLDIFRPDGAVVRPFQQAVQQQSRDAADICHVRASLAAAELHRVAENGGKNVGVPLAAVEVVGDESRQLPRLGVEQDGVDDAAADYIGHEGTADIVRRAELKGAVDVAAARFHGDHDGGDLVDPPAAVHFLQHLEAVRLGHHNIQQQRGDIALVRRERGDGLLAVGGLENIEVLLQHAHKDRAVQFGIVRDQQLSLIHEKISPSGRTAKEQPARPARRRRPRSGVLNIYLVSQPAARMAPSASSSVGSTLG